MVCLTVPAGGKERILKMTAAMTVAVTNERGGRSSVSGGDAGCYVRLGQSSARK